MEKLYSIDKNVAKIIIQTELYPIITVKKAIANFLEDVYIKLEDNDDKSITIYLVNNSSNDLEKIIGEFYNELLRESLRYEVACETKNIRELILARALYTASIETDDNYIKNEEKNEINDEHSENYSIDDIAVNWFDNNNEE